MSQNPSRNLAASVRQRLRNLAQLQQEDFQVILTRYAIERLLYRLDQSQYRDRFVLKGAILFTLWSREPHRATRDLDLLCWGNNGIAYLEQVFRELCLVEVEPDGLAFKPETVRGEIIKADQAYEGVRIKLNPFFSGSSTRMALQVDIGFGDVMVPAAQVTRFPCLLEDFPAPSLQAYPPETVVAEKFQALVFLGIANSRMKDFYDLWYLAQNFEFNGERLALAFQATFNRRKTPLPIVLPLALTSEFFNDAAKQAQWKAFLRRGKLKVLPEALSEVMGVLQAFLLPPSLAKAHGQIFDQVWFPGGPWQ